MIKIILLITFYLISSFGDESNTLQKQNVLYVQNLIDKKEKMQCICNLKIKKPQL